MNTYNPDYTIHPGDYLAEVLEARGIRQTDFAKRAGISTKAVSQIINRKSLFSADLAFDFERILNIKAEIWMNMVNSWQLFQVKAKEEKQLAKKQTRDWLRRFPTRDLRKLGIIPKSRKPQEVAEALLRFFHVSSPEACTDWITKRSVAFRKSTVFSESVEATSIWLQIAEKSATKKELPFYDREKFKTVLGRIRSFTLLNWPQILPNLEESCNEAGVALVVVPQIEGTRLSGASWWFGSDRPIIALSLRHRSNDHFWFTFFHESAHILFHGKKGIFLDSSDGYETPDEREANEFARNLLIPSDEWILFAQKGDFFEPAIRAFAQSLCVHPGIVVGRLQYEGLIDRSWHNSLKDTIPAP